MEIKLSLNASNEVTKYTLNKPIDDEHDLKKVLKWFEEEVIKIFELKLDEEEAK